MSNRPRAFEERLKAALLARMPETPEPTPARSFTRRYGIPLAIAVATAVVAGLVAVALPGAAGRDGSLPASRSTSGPTASPTSGPGPEVVKDADGTIRVRMPKWEEAPALVAELQAVGARVAFVQKKPRPECSHPGGGYLGPRYLPGTETHDIEAEVLRGRGDAMELRINEKTVPPGHTLVIARTARPMLRAAAVSFGVIETSKVPSCEVDYSPSPEEEARMIAELDARRKESGEQQGSASAPSAAPQQPPASPPGVPRQ